MVRLHVLQTLKHKLSILGWDGHPDLVTPKPQAFLADATRTHSLQRRVGVTSSDTEQMDTGGPHCQDNGGRPIPLGI